MQVQKRKGGTCWFEPPALALQSKPAAFSAGMLLCLQTLPPGVASTVGPHQWELHGVMNSGGSTMMAAVSAALGDYSNTC